MNDASIDAADPNERAIRFYTLSIASYFIGVALNNVLIPWIVSKTLGLDAKHLGFAQAALMLPMALLVLVGGRIADRVERRRLFFWCYVLVAIPPLVLGVVSLSGRLSFEGLIVSLMAVGTVASVLNPTRDALLSRVAGPRMPMLVAKVSGIQYGVQIVGYVLAASLDWVSVGYVLIAQGAIWLTGAGFAASLPSDPPRATSVSKAPDPAISKLLRPVLLLATAMGSCATGAILVIVPLKIFGAGGTAPTLTAANVSMALGTVLATAVIIRRGGFRRDHGRRATLAGLALGVLICMFAAPLPLWAFVLLLAVFGILVGVLAVLLRSIVQNRADPAHRGRALALYGLTLMGGGPLGAAAIGVLVAETSLAVGAVAAGGVLLAVVVLLSAITPLRRISAMPA